MKYINTNGHVDVLGCKPEQLREKLQESKQYDYVFIDFTGSLNIKGFNFEIFEQINMLIVPTRIAPDDIRSNFEFCSKILNPLKSKFNFNFYILFNMIENTSVDLRKLDILKDFCKRNQFNFFQKCIHKRKSYERYYYNNGGGFNSTILPIPDASLGKLTDEFKKIL